MSYDITGRLYKIFDTEQIKETFRKREIVVEQQDGQYPNYVKIELTQDRTGLIDGYAEGDEVTVSFDLRGREWNGKFFTNLNGWRIQRAGGQPAAPQGGAPAQAPHAAPAQEPAQFESGATKDDLPF